MNLFTFHRDLCVRIMYVLILGLGCALPCSTSAQPLDGLKPDHPRVLATAADFDRIRQYIKQDPLARQWYEQLQTRCQEMMDEPPARYELRDGRRLLYVSREVLRRVLALSLLHQLEPDPRLVERVWQDMQAVAAFDHWNPDHFLDVAEMAFACGIAYDWLYDQWTPEQRHTIEQAILRHGIEPGLRGHEQGAWWTKAKNNWNQVCHGGLIAASLAVADRFPEAAGRMVEEAVDALPISMARYAPDGGYDEGPGYWSYGTHYNIIAISALETALGNDRGLGDLPGFEITATFPLQLTGATGRLFNFADGSEKPFRSSALFYLAKRYDQPAFAQYAADNNPGTTYDLLWYDPELLEQQKDSLPTHDHFEGAGVGVVRSAWGDSDAWYLAAKAGDLPTSHGQLDLGSFVLEHQGVRWLIDLGADDYNLPGYFHGGHETDRWDYYRNRAEGHNTLVVNPKPAGPDQRLNANAPIVVDADSIKMDLSRVYGGKISRTLVLNEQAKRVRLTDTIELQEPGEVWWFAHTRARVDVDEDGKSATLMEDGKRMRVQLHSPADARLQLMHATPLPGSPNPEGQNPNNGARKINLERGAGHVRAGTLPQYGEPDPDQAIRKLAIQLKDFTTGRIVVTFSAIDPEDEPD